MDDAERVAADAVPRLSLSVEAFRAYLCEHGIDPRATYLSDVYLSAAALAGDAWAMGELERLITAVAPQSLRATRSVDLDVTDLVQELFTTLVVGETCLPGKLVQYRGRGPLKGWLRTCAIRICLMRARRKQYLTAEQALDTAFDPSDDPELASLKEDFRASFREALLTAFAELEPRDRNVLRYYYVDKLEQTQIASIYGVHAASISRWLANARHAVLVRTRAQLPESSKETWSLVCSRVDVSLRGLLRSCRE